MSNRCITNLLFSLLLALSVGSIGCDKAAPYREVAREQIQNMQDLVSLLRPITDLDSLKAKKSQLMELYKRMEVASTRANSLAKPTFAIKDTMKEDDARMAEAREVFSAELNRVRKLPGANEIFEEVAKMSAALREPMNSP